jgi:hypothetical protein
MGDLVHIPSGAYRILHVKEEDPDGQMAIPFHFSLTTKPILGVFKRELSESQCIVLFHDGEYVLDKKTVYLKNGDTDDRTSNDNESIRELVLE